MKTLALNILDIIQNSIRAKASNISVTITESETDDTYVIEIEDDGNGIPNSLLPVITDPFVTTRTKRRMGMGLALIKYHAEITGGDLKIASEEGKGTKVTATFSYSHFDRQPLGDIGGVIKILIAANRDTDFSYKHKTDKGNFSFSTTETKQVLEIQYINDYELLEDIKNMINENLEEIGASGLELRAGA